MKRKIDTEDYSEAGNVAFSASLHEYSCDRGHLSRSGDRFHHQPRPSWKPVCFCGLTLRLSHCPLGCVGADLKLHE